MSSKTRSEVFESDEVGVYHCWNRLVQRRHLFGWDRLTGRDYSYRKDWVRDRLIELASGMAVDILDYGILDNHLHLVLRNRPDIVTAWSDEEVARRWWYVCPLRRNKDRSIPEPLPCEIKLFMVEVDEYRKRLSDISWLMRLACQPIARRANQEDHVDGRFFAHRFECNRLQTVADLLALSIYVDLNAIRAGMAATPEESAFTSAYDRIRARWQQTQQTLGTTLEVPLEAEADAWLAPIFLDERAAAYEGVPQSGGGPSGSTSEPRGYNPIGSPRISNKGFLPTTLDQYLSLLDALGRVVRTDKRGFIPPNLPPILERLQIDTPSWLEFLWDLFDEGTRATVHPAFAGAE